MRNHEDKDIITNQREGNKAMKKVTLYVARDGTAFDNEPQCKAHEDNLDKGHLPIISDDRKRLADSMRTGLEDMKRKLNFLKSNANSKRTLSYLTKRMMEGRTAYKEALKKADYSVASMLTFGKVLSEACESYCDWHEAYTELCELRDQIIIAEDGIYELTYGKKRTTKPKKRIITIDLGMLHPYRHHEKRKRKGR